MTPPPGRMHRRRFCRVLQRRQRIGVFCWETSLCRRHASLLHRHGSQPQQRKWLELRKIMLYYHAIMSKI